ncbi:fixN, partial [Symbiodinium microadriaticum]
MKINSNYSLKNILVATDFSPGAWQAIKVSAGLASNCDCKVFIVHVQSDEVDETDTRYMEHLNKIKEDVSQIAVDLGETYNFRIESAVLSGNVTAELNRFVEENDIDLILMGANSSFDGHADYHVDLGPLTEVIDKYDHPRKYDMIVVGHINNEVFYEEMRKVLDANLVQNFEIHMKRDFNPEDIANHAHIPVWTYNLKADEELKEEFEKVDLKLPDIHCTSCIWLLENLRKLNPAVLSCKVNFSAKKASILFDKDQINLKELAELLSAIGYSPDFSEEANKIKSRTSSHLIRKVAVAGFCFGNSMLISIPEYLDTQFLLEESFSRYFGFINLLLSLPVLFFSANGYFKSSLASLKHLHINMDLPIAIGILALFGRSVFEIITTTGPGYIDSMTGLVFFLLVGQWYQSKTYEALSFDRDFKSFFPIAVTRIENESESHIPLEQMKKGDLIKIHQDEIIPADGEIVTGIGEIDYSFITGESKTELKNQGDTIFAGGWAFDSFVESAIRQGGLLESFEYDNQIVRLFLIEYAELEWPIDIAIALIWVVFGINMFGTILKRRERHLYVAIWFYIATFVTVAMLHIVNSVELPISIMKSYSWYAGVQDALVQWWYGHNAVAFFLTTPYLGLMYYFVPKAANRPVYSYRLSIVHFWALIFIYIWAGPHHLLYSSLPDWAQSLGVVFSVMLIAPSWGGMLNGLFTLRGAWDRVREDPILKFFVVAITCYGMSTFEGPMLSLKNVNAIGHFTDWIIAHVHVGGLGWNGFLTFGILYFLIPRMYKTQIFSLKLANFHFWIGTIGIIFYALPMYWAGFTQSLMWKQFTPSGQLAYPNFLETVTQIETMYMLRALGGLFYLTGVLVMVYNLVKTAQAGEFEASTKAEAAPLEKDYKPAAGDHWHRPFRSETERYGEYAKAGEFVYDHPFQWGSKRTGSIMPPYPWMFDQAWDKESTEAKISAMRTLG